MEKKELKYFSVDGGYGGNQDHMRDPWMYIGGCGALSACDTMIYLAKHRGMKHLYPFDANEISRKEYVRFGMEMKPYLKPRFSGIDKTSIYVEGLSKYLKDVGETRIHIQDFQGDEDAVLAATHVMNQINQGFPVPFLTLNHTKRKYKDYVWHWYILNGYEYDGERMRVKAATYGHYRWLDFGELWNTGYSKKGGMILLSSDSLKV